MNWETFYLICFVIGFALSLLSLVSGFHRLHLPGHVHVGHGGLHHLGGLHHGGAHLPVGQAGGGADVGGLEHSPLDFSTIMAFLAWFGGTGYLLVRYSNIWTLLALGIATLSGLGGGAIVFWFTAKVVLAHEAESVLNQADYEMTGVLGKVSVSIRPGGTGEIIYSQAGTRHTCGARSEEGISIAKGSEVLVTRYEHGIAYVRRWEDMAGNELNASDK